jgi:hypothetical protein
VSQLEAERAIRRALQGYCRGVDRLDPVLIARAYHPDAWDDRGDLHRGPASQVASKVVERLSRATEHTVHFLGDSTFDFEGDRAYVETYVTVHLQARDAEGRYVDRFLGRYVDRFERRDGEWRIADRKVVHDLDFRLRLPAASGLPGAFLEGRRDRSDASYGRLGSEPAVVVAGAQRDGLAGAGAEAPVDGDRDTRDVGRGG